MIDNEVASYRGGFSPSLAFQAIELEIYGDEVLRMLVTGRPQNFGGGGMPQRIMASLVPLPVFLINGPG